MHFTQYTCPHDAVHMGFAWVMKVSQQIGQSRAVVEVEAAELDGVKKLLTSSSIVKSIGLLRLLLVIILLIDIKDTC